MQCINDEGASPHIKHVAQQKTKKHALLSTVVSDRVLIMRIQEQNGLIVPLFSFLDFFVSSWVCCCSSVVLCDSILSAISFIQCTTCTKLSKTIRPEFTYYVYVTGTYRVISSKKSVLTCSKPPELWCRWFGWQFSRLLTVLCVECKCQLPDTQSNHRGTPWTFRSVTANTHEQNAQRSFRKQ